MYKMSVIEHIALVFFMLCCLPSQLRCLHLCVFLYCPICIEYARTLTFDLAFMFKGYDEQTL